MLRMCFYFFISMLASHVVLRAEVLTAIPSSVAESPKAFWGAVMEEFYGHYDKRLKCWISHGHAGKLCMRPHLLSSVSDQGIVTHYAAMAGYALTPEGGRNDCHACAGKLGLVILRDAGSRLALVARNGLADDAGSWGAPPPEEAFRVVRLGQGNYGWLMEFSYTGQGYTEGGVAVFGAVGDKVVDLGFIPTHSDNGGTCGDGMGACYVHSYEILTDPTLTEAPFGDLLARTVENTNAEAPAMFRIKFSQDELKYHVPEDLGAALGR